METLRDKIRTAIAKDIAETQAHLAKSVDGYNRMLAEGASNAKFIFDYMVTLERKIGHLEMELNYWKDKK